MIALWSTERMLGPLSTPWLSSSPWSSLPSFSVSLEVSPFFPSVSPLEPLPLLDLSALPSNFKMSPDTASLMNLRHPGSSYASRQSTELSVDPCHCILRGSTRICVRVLLMKRNICAYLPIGGDGLSLFSNGYITRNEFSSFNVLLLSISNDLCTTEVIGVPRGR